MAFFLIIHMAEDEKGKHFLELIDKQISLQQVMISKLISLINVHGWDSEDLRAELTSLAKEYSAITGEINGLEDALNDVVLDS